MFGSKPCFFGVFVVLLRDTPGLPECACWKAAQADCLSSALSALKFCGGASLCLKPARIFSSDGNLVSGRGGGGGLLGGVSGAGCPVYLDC